jgi:hypothetical protein
MLVYFIGGIAARLATALCILAIALPYALRGGRVSRALGSPQEQAAPYLRRLWPHFWVGYAILVLSTLHAGTVMGAMRRANANGILAATGAFFLLLFEVVLGLTLKDQSLPARRPMRRLHFWTMAAFVAALGAHLWWNS